MTTFRTSRDVPASPEQVFAAFADPQRLARWWGPAGFTNTFKVCEFKPGGRWSLVMHGPDGKNYPNENIFAEVEPKWPGLLPHRRGEKARHRLLAGKRRAQRFLDQLDDYSWATD